jgi:predicted aspartyl protease
VAVYVRLEISSVSDRERLAVGDVRVNTASMLTWIPTDALTSIGIRPERLRELQRADGTVFTRWSVAVILHVSGRSTVEDVIICEPGDEAVVGWHALSGFNLRLDETRGQLVDAGPIPAAATTVEVS